MFYIYAFYVQILAVVAVILERNPEVNFDKSVEVNRILDSVLKLYRNTAEVPANASDQEVRDAFYRTKQSGAHGTYSFIAKATCSILLDYNIQMDVVSDDCSIM